jgi:hypothetical protein
MGKYVMVSRTAAVLGTVIMKWERHESIVHKAGTRVKGGICRSTVLIGNILSCSILS